MHLFPKFSPQHPSRFDSLNPLCNNSGSESSSILNNPPPPKKKVDVNVLSPLKTTFKTVVPCYCTFDTIINLNWLLTITLSLTLYSGTWQNMFEYSQKGQKNVFNHISKSEIIHLNPFTPSHFRRTFKG